MGEFVYWFIVSSFILFGYVFWYIVEFLVIWVIGVCFYCMEIFVFEVLFVYWFEVFKEIIGFVMDVRIFLRVSGVG